MHFDIVVVGGGVVGATTALALASSSDLKIALLDEGERPDLQEINSSTSRISAISFTSQCIFENLNVFAAMRAAGAAAFDKMHVWEKNGKSALHFSASDIREEALGFIIKDDVMRKSLFLRFAHYSNLCVFTSFVSKNLEKKNKQFIISNDAMSISADLVIGADGAHSWVRKQTGFTVNEVGYNQSAIVATVTTQKPHAACAWQCFLPTGPLAFLPLKDEYTSAIVWSAERSYAQTLLTLTDAEFRQELAHALQFKLGAILEVSSRQSFPLCMRGVKTLVKEGVALVGDAAHTIHPLAGQGVNLGLLDAVFLVDVVTHAYYKGRSIYSLYTLRKYERARREDIAVMSYALHLLHHIFLMPQPFMKILRNQGLQFTQACSPLKKIFMQYAMGKRANLPPLATKTWQEAGQAS